MFSSFSKKEEGLLLVGIYASKENQPQIKHLVEGRTGMKKKEVFEDPRKRLGYFFFSP